MRVSGRCSHRARDPVRVEVQRAGRHRTVDEHRQHRNPVLIFEVLDPVQHFLDAANGKRRNDQPPPAGRHVIDDARQPLAVVVGLVQSIAVGGFEEQDVRLADRDRVRQDRPSVPPEVAAEEQRLAAGGNASVGRAEQVTRVDELDLDPRNDRDGSIVTDRLQSIERANRIVLRIERQRRTMPGIMMTIGLPRVFFLNPRGIRQDQRAQVARPRRAEDTPAESGGNQPRQIAAVVEVRVREHDRVDPRRIDEQRSPIAKPQLFQP